MRLVVIVSVLLLIGRSNCKAQIDTLQTQKYTAIKFMSYLEHKKVDSALQLLEPDGSNDVSKIMKELVGAAKDIESIVKNTTPLIMLVRVEGENIYRCRYIYEKDQYPEFLLCGYSFQKKCSARSE